jgi:hypothetical protein
MYVIYSPKLGLFYTAGHLAGYPVSYKESFDYTDPMVFYKLDVEAESHLDDCHLAGFKDCKIMKLKLEDI